MGLEATGAVSLVSSPDPHEPEAVRLLAQILDEFVHYWTQAEEAAERNPLFIPGTV